MLQQREERARATRVARMFIAEYARQPPFSSGTLDTAGPEIGAAAKTMLKAFHPRLTGRRIDGSQYCSADMPRTLRGVVYLEGKLGE